jgi:perosamine synthetase
VIPVSEACFTDREVEYVGSCIRSGRISSSGPLIEEFEEKWSQYCGRKYGVSVCNGTAALQISVAALDLKEGDEVILPTFTIISCALAVLYAGATPVLVDADPRTWTMDVSQIAAKINTRTKAIMVVHIYGHPVDMDPILALAQRHGLAIIEDAAEAHGAEYLSRHAYPDARWARCGSFGTASCFSFYGNKAITTGEGGMVLTDDAALAERFRALRNLCFGSGRRFSHSELGFNFRMTSMQAAVGLAQLERVDQIVEKKRWIGQEYTKRLHGETGMQLPVEEPWAKNMYWMYGIVLSQEIGTSSEAFSREMADRGVETRPFFLGMHEQPVFRQRGLFKKERYPVSEWLARQGVYLPSGLALTEAQLSYVVDAAREVARQ